jgi:hypothetical protein
VAVTGVRVNVGVIVRPHARVLAHAHVRMWRGGRGTKAKEMAVKVGFNLRKRVRLERE